MQFLSVFIYCNIKPGLVSDHSLVKIELTIKESVKRGKGTCKFNNNLLIYLLVKYTFINAI